MKLWAQIGVRASFSWPTKELSIPFGNLTVRVLPETTSLAPRVATTYDESSELDEALLILRRFLSAVAWIEDAAVEEVMALGGTVLAGIGRGVGEPPYRPPISPRYDLDHVPYSDDRTVQLALALYREALSVNSDAYRLLGFFKILNVLYPTGAEKKAWNRVGNWLSGFHLDASFRGRWRPAKLSG